MTGTDANSAAIRAAPSRGCLTTRTSAYFTVTRTVSASFSPFSTDVPFVSANPSAVPPSRVMADSKLRRVRVLASYFFFQAEDGIRDYKVTGVQTCALPISDPSYHGVVFSQLPEELRPAQFILKCRLQYQRDVGPAIAPFNSFLFLQGLETLDRKSVV